MKRRAYFFLLAILTALAGCGKPLSHSAQATAMRTPSTPRSPGARGSDVQLPGTLLPSANPGTPTAGRKVSAGSNQDL